jgi:hypothetical protein
MYGTDRNDARRRARRPSVVFHRSRQVAQEKYGSVRTVVEFRYFHSYPYMYPAYLAGVGLITYNLPSSYAEAEDASSESDIRKATAQLVSSATKLRISVEDRRLSLDVSGKSSSELRERLDFCNKRIREAHYERDELDDSDSKIALSIGTL